MPRIRCHYSDCVLIIDNYCTAVAVEVDPNNGCATYSTEDSVVKAEDEQDEDEFEELEEWEDDDIEEDDDKNDDEY